MLEALGGQRLTHSVEIETEFAPGAAHALVVFRRHARFRPRGHLLRLLATQTQSSSATITSPGLTSAPAHATGTFTACIDKRVTVHTLRHLPRPTMSNVNL